MELKLRLPDKESLRRASGLDPVWYYYHPLVGWLYRARIDTGLALLTQPVDSILELGCASGIMAPTLRSVSKRYAGIDLALPEGPIPADVQQMDASRMSYPDGSFDAVVAFSLFEHLTELDRTLKEIARVMKPTGVLIAGFPQLGRMMNAAFDLLGTSRTKSDHINDPAKILASLAVHYRVEEIRTLPSWLSYRTALYTCVRCVKRS